MKLESEKAGVILGFIGVSWVSRGTLYPSSQKHTIIVTYKPGEIIPPNTIFLHRIKDISVFKSIYANHSNVYLSPFQSTSRVC